MVAAAVIATFNTWVYQNYPSIGFYQNCPVNVLYYKSTRVSSGIPSYMQNCPARANNQIYEYNYESLI